MIVRALINTQKIQKIQKIQNIHKKTQTQTQLNDCALINTHFH